MLEQLICNLSDVTLFGKQLRLLKKSSNSTVTKSMVSMMACLSSDYHHFQGNLLRSIDKKTVKVGLKLEKLEKNSLFTKNVGHIWFPFRKYFLEQITVKLGDKEQIGVNEPICQLTSILGWPKSSVSPILAVYTKKTVILNHFVSL